LIRNWKGRRDETLKGLWVDELIFFHLAGLSWSSPEAT